MAGSFGHLVDGYGNYCGTNLVDNMEDAIEALDEFVFYH